MYYSILSLSSFRLIIEEENINFIPFSFYTNQSKYVMTWFINTFNAWLGCAVTKAQLPDQSRRQSFGRAPPLRYRRTVWDSCSWGVGKLSWSQSAPWTPYCHGVCWLWSRNTQYKFSPCRASTLSHLSGFVRCRVGEVVIAVSGRYHPPVVHNCWPTEEVVLILQTECEHLKILVIQILQIVCRLLIISAEIKQFSSVSIAFSFHRRIIRRIIRRITRRISNII